MIIDVFNVYEKDETGQFSCDYFGEDRDGAIQFLKMRDLMLTQQLKGWHKETGINHSIWKKGNQFVDLYFEMCKVDTKDYDD